MFISLVMKVQRLWGGEVSFQMEGMRVSGGQTKGGVGGDVTTKE